MPREIKRPLPRTSAVERTPIRYPVVWAHDETEVTRWDPVCSGNPRAVFPKAEDEVEKGFWSTAHLLNGGGQPPPSKYTVVVAYPRLTRRTPYIPRDSTPTLGPKDKACQDIAALTKYEDSESRLMDEVLLVANKHGPLWPGRNTSEEWDTLRAWKAASKRMAFYFALVKSVKEHSERLGGTSREEREAVEYNARHLLVESAPPEMEGFINDFTDTGPFGRKQAMVDLPLTEFRVALSSHFWSLFSMNTYSNATLGMGTPGQVYVECGSYAWAHKELWELLNSRQHVLLCHICNTAFVATRNDALTCSDACGKALQRQRAARRGAI